LSIRFYIVNQHSKVLVNNFTQPLEFWRGCMKIKSGEPIRCNWCGKIYHFYKPG